MKGLDADCFVQFCQLRREESTHEAFTERLNGKSVTGYNTSTYLGFVTITAKRDTLTDAHLPLHNTRMRDFDLFLQIDLIICFMLVIVT